MNQRLTLWQKYADLLTKYVGSWAFIILTILGFGVWIYLAEDLLIPNIVLSVFAIIVASIILMNQNRMSEKDRIRSEKDYKINQKAEKQIQEIIKILKTRKAKK